MQRAQRKRKRRSIENDFCQLHPSEQSEIVAAMKASLQKEVIVAPSRRRSPTNSRPRPKLGVGGSKDHQSKKPSKRKQRERVTRKETIAADEEDVCHWLQCDACGKWRRCPLSMKDAATKGNKPWVCNMNSWSRGRNTCDKEEEAMVRVHNLC